MDPKKKRLKRGLGALVQTHLRTIAFGGIPGSPGIDYSIPVESLFIISDIACVLVIPCRHSLL